jgi:hypothetical protein
MPVTLGRFPQGLLVQQTGMWSHMQEMKLSPVLALIRVLLRRSYLRASAVA